MRSVCVFCGSRKGANPAFEAAARGLGTVIAGAGLSLVYGGGRVGLMGVVADGVLGGGGWGTGVLPDALVEREVGRSGVSDLRVVSSMHERKALMAELSDGFIALPGGMGTLEELAEVLTWAQLGEHAKPCGVLNVEGYFAPLLALFDHMVTNDFLSADQRSLLLVDTDPAELLARLQAYEPPRLPRWIGPDKT